MNRNVKRAPVIVETRGGIVDSEVQRAAGGRNDRGPQANFDRRGETGLHILRGALSYDCAD